MLHKKIKFNKSNRYTKKNQIPYEKIKNTAIDLILNITLICSQAVDT